MSERERERKREGWVERVRQHAASRGCADTHVLFFYQLGNLYLDTFEYVGEGIIVNSLNPKTCAV